MLYLIKKEDIFNEDWSEFLLCDWNQLLGSKVSHSRFTDNKILNLKNRTILESLLAINFLKVTSNFVVVINWVSLLSKF